MKLEIKASKLGFNSKIILDGKDISNKITEISFKLKPGEMPKAVIEVSIDEIEADGEFEVLKDIKEKENITVEKIYCDGRKTVE